MKFLLSFSFLIWQALTIAGQNAATYNLKECLLHALEHSPYKKQIDISRRQSAAELQLKQSEFLPQVNAYSDYRQYFDNTTYLFPSEEGQILSGGESSGPYPIRLGQKFNLFAGVNFSQVLFDKRWLISREYRQISDEVLSLAEQSLNDDLIWTISTSYYEIQKTKSKLNVSEAAIGRLADLKSIMQFQVDNGVVKKSEIDRLNLKKSKLEIDKQRLENGIAQLVARLKYAMGMDNSTSLIIEDEELIVNELSVDSQPSKHNSLLDKQVQLSELRIKSAADSYFPTVKAFGDFQFQAQRSSFSFLSDQKWYPQHYFGVGLKFPILTGFEKKAKIELEQVELQRVMLERDNNLREESIEVQHVREQLATAKLYLEYAQQTKSLSEVLLKQVQLEYEQGISGLKELILALSDQTEAANQYEEAYFEYKLAQINYLKASSGLNYLLQ